PRYYEAFERILSKGGSVTLVMADPRSPAMWLRYREEPNPLWPAPNPSADATAWLKGLEELAGEAKRLDDWRIDLRRRGVNTAKLRIRVFPHYPSHAFYIFDDRIFLYTYPYGERGFHSPAYLYTNPNTPTHKFLLRCAADIVTASTPLDSVAGDIWRRYQSGDLTDQKVAASSLRITAK